MHYFECRSDMGYGCRTGHTGGCMDAHKRQLRRAPIVGTVVVLILGGALLAATILPRLVGFPSGLQQSQDDAVPMEFKETAHGLAAARPTTPALPTIPVPTTALAAASSAGA